MGHRDLCSVVVSAVVVLAGASDAAWGQARITTAIRSLEAEAEITNSGSGPRDLQRFLNIDEGPWAQSAEAFVSSGSLFADADASMTTTVSPWEISGRGDVSLVSEDDGGFTRVGGVADAQLFVRFEVVDPIEAMLDMRVARSSNAADQFSIRLTGPGGDLLNSTTFDGTRAWTLGPGEYTFRVQTRFTWNGNVNRDLNATGLFEGSLLLPSPGTVAPLGAVCMLASRRRRTR